MISEKKILQTDVEGKNLARKNLGKKIPALKKYLSFKTQNAGNKSYTTVCQRKKFFNKGFGNKITQAKSPIPTSKVKWSTP